MWYGGTLTTAASSSPAPPNSSELTRYDARLRCRRTAAFGSPVVPLVKSSTAVASASQPQPSVSGTVSSSTAARNASRSMTSMPSIPVEPFGDARTRHHDGRGGALDDRPQSVVGQAVVHRYVRLARDGGAVEGDRDGERVLVHQHDVLALRPGQEGARPAGPMGQLGEGEPSLARSDGDAVAQALPRHLQDHAQVHGDLSRRTGAAWRP